MRSYDYVVVGAGSAGCVLAARLTEDDAEVLLLEAGPPDSDPNIWNPAAWPALWGTERDYGFSTVAQKHAAGRRLYWPRGRTLGGSSAVNGMIYVRGHRADYDAWAYDGCLGWDYASVLPYFKKSENYEGGADVFHGAGGPLNVARNHNPHPVCRAAVEAAIEAGFPFNADFNGADTLGVGYTDLTIKDGRRQSAAAAFLGPASNRPNLSIRTDAQVLRLQLRKDRCVGVEVAAGGQVEIIAARREVILSAGTIGSPQILMLSGIGNARTLAAAGIDVIHPLRGVGRNLHDHLLCSVILEARRDLPPPQHNFLESQLFCKSDSRWPLPDLQPLFMHLPYYPPGVEGPPSAWTLCAGIVRPASRGFMRLAPGHPRGAPLLDPNILASDADLHAMEQAIAICRDIGSQPALADWRKREILPGPDVRSSNAIRDYIRRAAVTYHHQVGTCRMGTDADAVVDPELRVHGLSGLRVADASVMPSITSGNTNAPTIMIAEKAADMIRATA